MPMSERQAVNLPIKRAKQARKRKAGESGEETVPVAEAASRSEQDLPPAAMPVDAPDGRGLETVEGLIGMTGVGIVGVVAAGVRGGSGGGEIAPTGDVFVPKPVSPRATGTLIPETREPVVTPPKMPTTKSPDLVEEVDMRGPGTEVPAIVRPTVEPTVKPAIEPEVARKIVPPIEVDTTPPGRPSLALKRDTGPDATDGITSDSTITVSDLDPDATWRYSLDGGKTWHTGTGTEFTAGRFDGAHDVQVMQTDQAGRVSEVARLVFALDTGAPSLSLKHDTARLRYDFDTKTHVVVDQSHRYDGITSDGTLILAGLRKDAIWQFSLDEGQSWRAGNGSEIPAREMGIDGRKTVWVRQKDEDGESGMSSFSFVLDTHVGELFPRLKSVEAWDRENRPVTSEPVIVFDGLEEGAVASWIMYGGEPVIVINPASRSAAELFFDGQVPPGPAWLVGVRQTDLAGNESPFAPTFNFVVVPPEAGRPAPMAPPSESILP
jgi:hypothetical protein